MPLQVNYETPDGVTHTESYWKVIECNISRSRKEAFVTLYGWHDKSCYDNLKLFIGEFSFLVKNGNKFKDEPQYFDDYFATSVLKASSSDPYKQVYEYAKPQEMFEDAPDVDI